MNTSKKNFSIAILASLLTLSFGSVQAQNNMESSTSSPTGTAPTATGKQNGLRPAPQTSRPSAARSDLESHTSGTAAQSGDAGASGATTDQAAKQGASSKQNPDAAVVYMMVPVEIATAGAPMQRGCWVKLYDAENYAGESLTLAGPTTINDMSGPFGINWDDRVESVQTGPQATLTVFDDEEFEERVAQFKPGQQVPDISRRMGFFDEFGSIRLDCQKS